jgi:hypothetical protein
MSVIGDLHIHSPLKRISPHTPYPKISFYMAYTQPHTTGNLVFHLGGAMWNHDDGNKEQTEE